MGHAINYCLKVVSSKHISRRLRRVGRICPPPDLPVIK